MKKSQTEVAEHLGADNLRGAHQRATRSIASPYVARNRFRGRSMGPVKAPSTERPAGGAYDMIDVCTNRTALDLVGKRHRVLLL